MTGVLELGRDLITKPIRGPYNIGGNKLDLIMTIGLVTIGINISLEVADKRDPISKSLPCSLDTRTAPALRSL